MDLRDRRGADGHFVEARIERFERNAEGLLDRGLHGGERRGGEVVLQPGQVFRGIRADEIGARGERLSELDRGGAEHLEGVGIVRRLRCARSEPGELCDPAQQRRRLLRGLDLAQRTVPRERSAPAQHPKGVDDAGGQIFQPLCMATTPPRMGRAVVCAKPASPIIDLNVDISGKRRIDSTRY